MGLHGIFGKACAFGLVCRCLASACCCGGYSDAATPPARGLEGSPRLRLRRRYADAHADQESEPMTAARAILIALALNAPPRLRLLRHHPIPARLSRGRHFATRSQRARRRLFCANTIQIDIATSLAPRQNPGQGRNAVDAAVATAAVLSIVEPMMVGVASDLFAVIYVAKEGKVYVLNASGTAPTGATLERLNKLGYRADPKNWGPSSGHADVRDPPRYGSRHRLGMAGRAPALRHAHLQGRARTRCAVRAERLSGLRADRERLALARRAPAATMLQPRSIRIRSKSGTSGASRRRRDSYSRTPTWRVPCVCSRAKARMCFIAARSQKPSSPNRRRSAVP